uniref:NADH-ubiquinone oxidoreductase chain 2 n=1 Tax=Parochlus steinenii TaxID=315571 RepID=A0A0H4T3E3_9DIPT|nr:NADH dehydrogenase subunit 2 [Parochlus steinenii]AKP94953.1 NADH dehydrogenase subunit 2 [Parochlus steinenii]
MLFLITLMSGTFITISSNSWLGAWMGLEINLLSFIPLMINTNNLMSSEASLKYFLTQALASSVFLFAVALMFILDTMSNPFLLKYSNLLISSALLLKSGAAPFHFWFPGVMEGLNWNNSLILMTWQKIAPLMLLSYCLSFNFLCFIVILSILIGSLGGLNQTSLRKLMAFSSINHLGWMIAGMINSETLWMSYFVFYCLLSTTIVILFHSFNLFHVNQMFVLFNNNSLIKCSLFVSFLSLGGLPPFLGFMPKWLIIESLVNMNSTFLLTTMVCLTLITLFFYIRICYSAFLLNHNENSWNFNNFYNNKIYLSCLFSSFCSIFGLFFVSLFYWMF